MRRRTKTQRSKRKFNYKKLKKPIKWLDCVSQTGWISEKDIEDARPSVCTTSDFWVYKDTSEYITLFGTYSKDEDGKIEFGEVITIPKKWV
tara:strand:+ start:207 stop:479 length:273 start_codon:yes stop_codon:yes gene_type:complete